MAGDLYDINVIYNPSTPETILVSVSDLAGGAPTGGTVGQALVKLSSANWDMDWDFVTGVPDGGTTGQTIQKTSAVDGEAAWADIVLVGNPASPPAGLGVGQLLWDQGAVSPQDSVITARFSLSAANTSIPNGGTGTAISWTVRTGESVLWDVANPTRLVAPTAGVYLVNATVRFDPSGAVGPYACWLNKNAGNERLASMEQSKLAGNVGTMHISTIIPLAAADYMTFVVYQASGAAANVNGDAVVSMVTSATMTRLA